MAAIENLEIVVDVDISNALAALDELQQELRDLADTINDVDARGTEGIDISTSVDDLDAELTALESEIETFEATESIDVRARVDKSRVRDFDPPSKIMHVTPTIDDFDIGDDATSSLEDAMSGVREDLGLEGMEDGELAVNNMRVAAGRVTVIGDGDESFADAIDDVLRGFSADVGDRGTRGKQVDKRDLRGVKKPLMGPGFLTMGSPTAADDDDLREGMGMLFGDEKGDMFSDIGQQLAEASANAKALNAESIPKNLRDSFDELGVSARDVTDAMERRASILSRTGDHEGTPFEGIFDNLDQSTSRAKRLISEDGLSSQDARDLGFDDIDDFDQQLRKQMDFDAAAALRDSDIDLESEMGLMPEDATAQDIGNHLATRMTGGKGRFSRMSLDFDFGDGGRGNIRKKLFKGLGNQVTDLRKSISNFDLRMSDIHNMLARLVPMLLIFIGVIPAAITAVLGLAAAAVAAAAGLAALTGLGAMGLALEDGQFNMDNLREAAQDIKSDFIEAFAPLAERLQPLFEDGLDGLTKFFEAIAGQGDVLVALTDEARAFGGFLMEFVPMVLNAMGSMADALSPILGNIGEWMKTNLHDVVRTLVKLTAQATPVIADLALKIGRMLPGLVQMSIGFAKVASIILSLIGLLARFLDWLGMTPRLFGLIAAGALAAASAILLANSALIGLIVKGFLTLAGVVYSSFVPSVAAIVAGFTSSAVATYIATAALASFLTLATLGAGLAIVAMATSAASGFLGLADSIGQATNNLKEYNRVSGRSNDNSPNSYNQGVRGANLGGSGPRGGNVTVIESNGDNEQARSDGAYAAWRQGRTTGDSP